MKPTTKTKVTMLVALLNNEFNAHKKAGNYKECVGIEKSIQLVKEVFKVELK